MPNQEIIELRNRVLGVLIRSYRERSRLSRKECADVLGVSSSRFASYEDGLKPVSLPELELLSRYLEVPFHKFRSSDNLSLNEKSAALPAPEFFLPLRNRIIGARLKQERLSSGRTQKDVAEILECSSSSISDYEYGRRPISLAELEILARALEVPLDVFVDQDSVVGTWHALQEKFEQFVELPVEMQDFVLRPINRSYLELAMKLADMPAGALRQIAEGLLEITY